jgi:hypothetical protein
MRLNREVRFYDPLLSVEVVEVRKKRPDYDEKTHQTPLITEMQLHLKRRKSRNDPAEEFLVALTRDWTTKSEPVDWGIEPLLAKIKDMDIHNRGGEDLFEEIDKVNQKEEALADSGRRHMAEEGARVLHESFKKSMAYINTAGMQDPRMKKLKKRHFA